jgi:drug/metabolite transporter (DMT)-like permease
MKSLRYVAAGLAVAGVVMLVAGPFWAVMASDIGRSEENFGLGDGTVNGEWLPGQVFLMVGGAVFCVAAVVTAYLSRRGHADD